MKDRVPGSPGRYSAVVPTENLQALQTGQPFTITLVRDDDPIEPGTPYSKAAVLPDSVAEAICPYVENPTPADAFMALHNGKAPAGNYAPAGYGYGEFLYIGAEAGESLTEKVDALTASWANNTSKQYTVFDHDFYSYAIIATISKYNSNNVVITGTTYNGLQVIRRKNSVWSEWEWVNPPMASGVEYRTTERMDGKPVYVRVLVTDIPATEFAALTVPISPGSQVNLVDVVGILKHKKYSEISTLPYFDGVTGDVAMNISHTDKYNVYAATSKNMSDYKLYITVKYTKDS